MEEDIGASNFSYCGFEDMLLDEDRNSKYRKAIEKVVQQRLKIDGEAHVLDIGSGTGLLSLYAAKAGATSVTAIELDPIIFEVSKKIAKRNGFGDLIKFINAESTEIEKLPQLANILVSEIFDSELLGENVLRTFKHALQNLTTPDVICIPARADVYIVPIESRLLSQQCRLPGKIEVNCEGNLTAIDSHWLTSGRKTMEFASEPCLFKSFILNDMESIALEDSIELEFTINRVEVDGVFLWWDLDLSGDGESIITTGTVKDKPRWRNHWLPVAYGFPQQIRTSQDEKLYLIGSHDEVSFQFNIKTKISENNCTCQWHSTISPGTFLRWNTNYKKSPFVELTIKESLDKNILLIGSHSLLPYFLKAKKIIVMGEEDERFCDLISTVCQSEIEFVESLCEFDQWNKIDLIIFDVHSNEPSSPIEFAKVYYSIVNKDIKIIPEQLELKTMPLKFENLWRRKMHVKQIDEFDYTDFNDCFGKSQKATSDDELELLPLWEEVCYSKGKEATLFSFNSSTSKNTLKHEISIPDGSDAFVFYFTANHEGNPIYDPFKNDGQKIEWFEGCRQWIYFLEQEDSKSIKIEFKENDCLNFIVCDSKV